MTVTKLKKENKQLFFLTLMILKKLENFLDAFLMQNLLPTKRQKSRKFFQCL